jgi:hypothetical protein
VRGVTHASNNDPNAGARIASNPGGNSGNAVGSLQYYATGKPNTAFTTSSDGLHNHNVPHAPVNNNAYAIAGSHYGIWNSGGVTVGAAGTHSHSVSGGYNSESRPINRYVNFIIKFLYTGD